MKAADPDMSIADTEKPSGTAPSAHKAQPAGEQQHGDETSTAGRGAAALAAAKIYFIISGWAIYFVLPRILSADEWGDYLLVIGLTSIVNNVIVGGTLQSVSRFTACNETMAAQVRWAGLKMQTLLGWGSAILFVASGAVLSFWWEDTGLIPLFALMSLMVVFYSYYSVFVGSANGTRQFVKQAGLDMGYSTLKIFMVLGGAYLFARSAGRGGVAGALGGLVFTALIALTVSVFIVGLPSRRKPIQETRPLLNFALALFLFTFLLNLLMRVDLILLKRVGIGFAPPGVDGAVFASELAGRYGTAQVFAFVIMQVLMSVSFVVFPLVSRSTFENDHDTTRRYIKQTMRVVLITAAGLAAVLSSKSADIIGVVYPDSFRIGGTALRFLAWGIAALSVMIIACTIMNGAGKTRYAIIVVLFTLVLSATANYGLLYTARTPVGGLARAGIATAGSMLIGAVVAGIFVYRLFGALMSPAGGLRILSASALTFAAGYFMGSGSAVRTLVECSGLVLLYLVLLVLTGELGKKDLSEIAKMFRGKKQP